MPDAFPFIVGRLIEPSATRYVTVADWYLAPYDGGVRMVDVVQTGNPTSDMALFLHEATEQDACTRLGITGEMVDAYELAYTGPHKNPADDPDAPHHKPHVIAMLIEKLFVNLSETNWEDHDTRVAAVTAAVDAYWKGQQHVEMPDSAK
jgi:hypothetical protein